MILSSTSEPDSWMVEEYRKLGYEMWVIANKRASFSDLFKKRSAWGQALNSYGHFVLGWQAHKQYAGEARVVFWNWESSFFFLLRDWLTFRRCKAKIIALHLILLDTSWQRDTSGA